MIILLLFTITSFGLSAHNMADDHTRMFWAPYRLLIVFEKTMESLR